MAEFVKDPFEGFTPSLNDNISCGVVGSLFTEADFRCYCETVVPDTPAMIERFIESHAYTVDIFGKPKLAARPEHTFSWRANTGSHHQGMIYRNGVVYRQANPHTGRKIHFLLVTEETAVKRGYPSEGWVRLTDLQEDMCPAPQES
jgi:hypothetical protein